MEVSKAIEPRIAVFPFENSSSDPTQDHFGEGLAAELLIWLTRVPGLQLVARSSVFGANREGLEVEEVGEQLKSTGSLTGSVRLYDDRIGIWAELIETKTGFQVWKGEYDAELEEVFAILDEIVAGIVAALDASKSLTEVREIQSIHTSNIDAYNAYLRGREQFYQYSRSGVGAALESFRQAIDVDAGYALAFCGVADCYSYLYMYFESDEATLAQAESASVKALELDPLLAEAHTSHGIALSLRCDFKASEEAFEKAIDLDPKLFDAYYFYGRMCFAQGDLIRALDMFTQASVARPDDYQAPLLSGQILDGMHQPRKALAVRMKGIAIAEHHLKYNPEDVRALYMAANGLVVVGEVDKGLAWLERALAIDPEDAMLLYNAGCIYALLDMKEEALTSLERTVERGLTQREWYEHDSNLDSLRTNPRFEQLLKRMA